MTYLSKHDGRSSFLRKLSQLVCASRRRRRSVDLLLSVLMSSGAGRQSKMRRIRYLLYCCWSNFSTTEEVFSSEAENNLHSTLSLAELDLKQIDQSLYRTKSHPVSFSSRSFLFVEKASTVRYCLSISRRTLING